MNLESLWLWSHGNLISNYATYESASAGEWGWYSRRFKIVLTWKCSQVICSFLGCGNKNTALGKLMDNSFLVKKQGTLQKHCLNWSYFYTSLLLHSLSHCGLQNHSTRHLLPTTRCLPSLTTTLDQTRIIYSLLNSYFILCWVKTPNLQTCYLTFFTDSLSTHFCFSVQ